MCSPVCRHVTPGSRTAGPGCVTGLSRRKWAFCGRVIAPGQREPLGDVPSQPALHTAALLRFWLPVFQAQGAPAHPFFPSLSSAGNLGAGIPLVRPGDGGKHGPAHSRSDTASPEEQHALGETSSLLLLLLSAPSQNQELLPKTRQTQGKGQGEGNLEISWHQVFARLSLSSSEAGSQTLSSLPSRLLSPAENSLSCAEALVTGTSNLQLTG